MPVSKGKLNDQYLQAITVRVTEAVAGSGKIDKIETGFSSKDRYAIEIHRVEYAPYAAYQTLEQVAKAGGGGGMVRVGLAHLYRGGTIPLHNSHEGLICMDEILYTEDTAVGSAFTKAPLIREFKIPCIAHPSSLYAWCQGDSLAGVLDVTMDVWYKVIEINDDQWQELFESVLFHDKIA